jgi:putative SOS response-associated peptidase YedK
MFNARCESLSSKACFSGARKRCVVLMNGFYEWKPDPESKKKQPFYVYRADCR